MTRSERERLVARYLDGAMKGSEEEEFFILVAVDTELRRMLKAHRVIDNAIEKDRDAASQMHGATRRHVVAMLGGHVAADGARAVTGAAPAVAPVGVPAHGVLGRSAASWIAGAIGTVVLIAIAAFFARGQQPIPFGGNGARRAIGDSSSAALRASAAPRAIAARAGEVVPADRRAPTAVGVHAGIVRGGSVQSRSAMAAGVREKALRAASPSSTGKTSPVIDTASPEPFHAVSPAQDTISFKAKINMPK